jgi:uracil-DNA glycosylase family 4
MTVPALDASVRAVAAGARDVAELVGLADGCVACAELVATRRRVVVRSGPPAADVLLVGEAPGAEEDRTGTPFVGRAGQLLDGLLTGAGLSRSNVAVANVVQCRPPGNRPPKPAEVARCAGWLDRHLELVDPRLVVTLGRTATAWALGPRVRLTDVRGREQVFRGRLLLPTYHPSAALRFGPNGAPRAALAADLARAAALAARLRRAP